ncbi:methyl-accepting chemotaxis protein [Alkalicoccus chagannorensis]|uniref:methyl-accepting chemotaxis protein n=1 Tax=Alkalicoccus chagannorensis TaxID=427072 RepID=UPI00041DE1E7|nr:methyl-accepting chemotaxis protein [Alkalicoccus chagannorensis]
MKHVSIISKFYVVVFSIIAVLTAAVMLITFTEVESGIEGFASDKARSDLDLAYEYIDERYEGGWQLDDGQLVKGDAVINEHYELADDITDITGGLITIFQEDMPVTTNLIIGGERAVTQAAEGEVSALVLEEGERYSGEAEILDMQLQTAYRPLMNEDDEVVGMMFTGASQEAINSTMADIITQTAVVVGVIILLVTGALLFFTRNIKRRMRGLITDIERAGNGDLQAHEADDRRDELGRVSTSLALMKKNLRTLFEDVQEAAGRLSDSSANLTRTSAESSRAADEVAGTIEEIAKGASSQAEDTEKGAAHMQQMGTVIEEDQGYVKEVSTAADHIASLKDQGMRLVQELTKKTEENNETTNAVQQMIRETNENTSKIEEASGMIRNISEQTNLLALNASIEAARAGEAGRGFSVVAEEIRKLAEQSNRFSEEISAVIQELSAKTQGAVNRMEESREVAEVQTKSVNETIQTFEGVADAIEGMRKEVGGLNASGGKLESQKKEMMEVMESLSAVSQQNAASTEQMSAAVEEQTASMQEVASSSEMLTTIAEQLKRSLQQFRY